MASNEDTLKRLDCNNWCKKSIAVFIIRQAFVPIVKDEMNKFHSHLKELSANFTKCTSQTPCDVINYPCDFHKHIAIEVFKYHTDNGSGPAGLINTLSWKNSNHKEWETNPWEVAKLFLHGDGYKAKKSAEKTDINGIISVIVNFRPFCNTRDNVKLIQDVASLKKIRHQINNLRHIADNIDPCLTDTDALNFINSLCKVLDDLCPNSDCHKQAVHNARVQLNQLKTDAFKITSEVRLSVSQCDLEQGLKDTLLRYMEKEIKEIITSAKTEVDKHTQKQLDVFVKNAIEVKTRKILANDRETEHHVASRDSNRTSMQILEDGKRLLVLFLRQDWSPVTQTSESVDMICKQYSSELEQHGFDEQQLHSKRDKDLLKSIFENKCSVDIEFLSNSDETVRELSLMLKPLHVHKNYSQQQNQRLVIVAVNEERSLVHDFIQKKKDLIDVFVILVDKTAMNIHHFWWNKTPANVFACRANRGDIIDCISILFERRILSCLKGKTGALLYLKEIMDRKIENGQIQEVFKQLTDQFGLVPRAKTEEGTDQSDELRYYKMKAEMKGTIYQLLRKIEGLYLRRGNVIPKYEREELPSLYAKEEEIEELYSKIPELRRDSILLDCGSSIKIYRDGENAFKIKRSIEDTPIEFCSGKILLYKLMSGDAVTSASIGTIGCFVKKGSGDICALTAAHIRTPDDDLFFVNGLVVGEWLRRIDHNTTRGYIDAARLYNRTNCQFGFRDTVGREQKAVLYERGADHSLVGLAVHKWGAKSGITCGTIRNAHLLSGCSNLFVVQSKYDTPFATPGDSGALICAYDFKSLRHNLGHSMYAIGTLIGEIVRRGYSKDDNSNDETKQYVCTYLRDDFETLSLMYKDTFHLADNEGSGNHSDEETKGQEETAGYLASGDTVYSCVKEDRTLDAKNKDQTPDIAVPFQVDESDETVLSTKMKEQNLYDKNSDSQSEELGEDKEHMADS